MIEVVAGVVVAVAIFAAGYLTGLVFTARQVGRTLKSEIQSGRLSPDEATRIAELRR